MSKCVFRVAAKSRRKRTARLIGQALVRDKFTADSAYFVKLAAIRLWLDSPRAY